MDVTGIVTVVSLKSVSDEYDSVVVMYVRTVGGAYVALRSYFGGAVSVSESGRVVGIPHCVVMGAS